MSDVIKLTIDMMINMRSEIDRLTAELEEERIKVKQLQEIKEERDVCKQALESISSTIAIYSLVLK